MTHTSKNICIFTTFSDNPEAYSLNRVVKDQLKMLLRGGYTPVVIVADSFQPSGLYADSRVVIKKIPLVPVHNEVKKDETFDSDVESIYVSLKEILKDVDVVITHDIVYQPAALKHNIASRKLAKELPSIHWLHWIHSATPPATLSNLRPYFGDAYVKLMEEPFPNSKYVFFNHFSIPSVAENFKVSESQVAIVHHPSDLQEIYGLTDEVYKFVQDKKIYDADAICVYPIRLDRGKQVDMVIKTMAMLKEFHLSIKVIVVDFHSTGGDKLTYRDELKNLAIDYGLQQDELLWTSESSPFWEAEVPHDDVMGLMRMSNVFIMPSRSESYSLITQEAGMNKAVMVINQDFPPFRDIFGPHAIYRKFGSNFDILEHKQFDGSFTDRNYRPGGHAPEEEGSYEKKYHKETAGLIANELNTRPMGMAMFLRKYRNLNYVFEHELQPLFYG